MTVKMARPARRQALTNAIGGALGLLLIVAIALGSVFAIRLLRDLL